MHVSAYDRRDASVDDYEAGATLLRALASPVRLAIIDNLDAGESCVHELMDAVGLPQTQVSQHLRLLKDARLVTSRRRGREVVYSLVDRTAAGIVRAALAHRTASA
jgi:DNA-binding transcriptional ArsR family regulator